MKKRLFTLLLMGSMALALYGCGTQKSEEAPLAAVEKTEPDRTAESSPENEKNQESADVPETGLQESEEQDLQESFSFAEFEHLQFMFLSGAGGWATSMEIDPDGSFSGEYYDGELGVTGEDYPNGTQYRCDFSGKFTEPEKVDDFTWSMRIQEINYEKEPGTEEIINGMLFCYAEPYGLDGAEEILIYAPGYPLAELPEEYRSWVGYYDLSMTEDTELPFWGLYNEAQECGFSSYNIITHAKEVVASEELWTADLEDSLKNDPLSQTDLNLTSKQLYDVWDYALNDVWGVLMRVLEEEEKAALIAEEREWIAMKEAAVKEAGAKFEGGTMQSLEMNLVAAKLTKERVYELMELLPVVDE